MKGGMQRLANQEEQQTEKGDGSRFPWRDIGQWMAYWLAKLWDGLRSVGQRLKAIPPYRRNTYLAIASMIALLLLGGAILGLIIGSVGVGLLFVSAVTAVWLAVIYFKGNSILPLLAGAQPVKQGEHPELVGMVRDLAQTAELPVPSFWIAENPEVNAFACGRDSEHAAIVVYTGGLSIWKGDEIKGILAHEVAHIKNKDVLLDTFMRAIINGMEWSFRLFRKPFEWAARVCFWAANEESDRWIDTIIIWAGIFISWFLIAFDFLFGVLLLPATHLVQMAASRQQEYFADSTGAELVGSAQGLASALAKLHVMEQSVSSAHHERVRGFQGMMEQLWATHPPTQERVRRLGGALFAEGSKEASEILSEIEETGEETSESRYGESSVPLRIDQTARREVVNEKGGDVKYKVVPVLTNVLESEGSQGAARQLEQLINTEAAQGWRFVSLESTEIIFTTPAVKGGCFGPASTPESNRITRYDMAIFEK